jgi:GTPase SAR1 family protein
MNITEKPNAELVTPPFDDQNKRGVEIHPDLPYPPMSLMLVGPKGSGKSNLILRLLYGNRKPKGATNDFHKFYRHFFEKVYIFSPSWKLDPKMARCKIPEEQIFEDAELYPEIIAELLEGQAEDIEEEGKDETEHILMVFTDLAGAKGVFSSAKGIMNKLAFNLRHYKVSLIIDTQSLRQINPAFRGNLSGVVLFSGISNRLEIQKIYDEYLGEFTPDEQEALIDHCFQKPYDFLYINFQKHGLARFYHNFNPLKISKRSEDNSTKNNTPS